MFTIEMLPAAHGDAIWIEYGEEDHPRRVVVDGGPASTYENGLRRRILEVGQERTLDLLMVTHIDADHIDGALILLQEIDALKVKIGELWFNSWTQLQAPEARAPAPAPTPAFGALQGEFLGGLIQLDERLKRIWNARFKQEAVCASEDGPLPEMELPEGARLTLLGPTPAKLLRLRSRWSSALRDFTLTPGDVQEALRRLKERREYQPPIPPASFALKQPGEDHSPANGASLACVLEVGGAAILLAGDAHAAALAGALERLAAQRGVRRLHFDAVKLPHHGSLGNISEEWLRWVDCESWLISTNGAMFDHPDLVSAELIARTCPNPTLYCNYAEVAGRLEGAARGRWRVICQDIPLSLC